MSKLRHLARRPTRMVPLVGRGSVCRRQATGEIGHIVTALAGDGLRLHGFGIKPLGLGRYAASLASADSLAWSYQARREPPSPGCHHGQRGEGNCANCPRYALAWRTRVLRAAATRQLRLDLQGVAG